MIDVKLRYDVFSDSCIELNHWITSALPRDGVNSQGQEQLDIKNFVESLYKADSFKSAFEAYETEVTKLGFDGVLYTYIPQVIIDQSFATQPVFEVSRDYSPKYLQQYEEARFDRFDPLIKAVVDGENKPIDWWGPICRSYIDGCSNSLEVLHAGRDYGIENGLTLPLMSGNRGIAGASFITGESKNYDLLLTERLDALKLRTQLFHNLVISDVKFSGRFVEPFFAALNATEMGYICGLAAGKSSAQLAVELHRTEKYLEQLMLKVRRKLSGVSADDSPVLNRNQILYYAGLLNFLEYGDKRKSG